MHVNDGSDDTIGLSNHEKFVADYAVFFLLKVTH